MAGEWLPERFSLRSQLGFGGQESASKPPQAICKPLPPSRRTDRGKQNFMCIRIKRIINRNV